MTNNEILNSDPFFAKKFLKVLTKEKQVRPLILNPVQAHFLANLTGNDLALKARQVGISTGIQARFFRKVMTSTATTATLAHEDDTTQKLRRMANFFYDNLPSELKVSRSYANKKLTAYPHTNSEAIIATAGNTNAGRGGTYSHIHGSEVAFWKDAEGILAGITEGGNPQVVLESTPNGASGYFYDLCREAIDNPKTSIWKLHFYPWWWESQYQLALTEELRESLHKLEPDEKMLLAEHNLSLEQLAWRRDKLKKLKHLFFQEYPEDVETCFLLSTASFFGEINRAFRSPMGQTPQENSRYVAGIDWGQSRDFTVLSIFNQDTLEQVDLLRVNNLPWPEIRALIIAKIKYWGVHRVIVEANSAGSPNIEALRGELKSLPFRVKLIPFTMTNTSKRQIMANLNDAIQSDDISFLPIAVMRREFQAFNSRQNENGIWIMGGAEGSTDDIVVATALALHAALNNTSLRIKMFTHEAYGRS